MILKIGKQNSYSSKSFKFNIIISIYVMANNVKVTSVRNYWVKVKSLSRVRPFATPWTVAYQAPPSMGFSRQECWSGLPFPSPGDLPDPGIERRFPALQADAFTVWATRVAQWFPVVQIKISVSPVEWKTQDAIGVGGNDELFR